MLCSFSPIKKLKQSAGPSGPARGNGQRVKVRDLLLPSWCFDKGTAILEQLWTSVGSRGVVAHSKSSVSVLLGKAHFLPPLCWTRIYLPYRVIARGGVTITVALQRAGILAGLSVTRNGQIRVNVFNTTQEVIYLTPKTNMVNVTADGIQIKCIGKALTCASNSVSLDSIAKKLQEKICSMFPSVGDLSSHPVNEAMEKLRVSSTEVTWNPPPERGTRTQYAVQNVADRKLVSKQLEEYVQRGYLCRASVADDIYLSPLLPIPKPNGTFRFTNDFRKLNEYFPSHGSTTQIDAWRKMWGVNPDWKYFMEIDLKDGFFGIPVDSVLAKLFGFTFGDERFYWNRLPQGWKWSSPLFCERIAEILHGIINILQ